MPTAVLSCRVCGNDHLEPILDLGEQYLTGTFPRSNDGNGITKGPLQLVKCHGGENSCGLVQLRHNYDLQEMYGANYGYRSGLNYQMVQHLQRNVERIRQIVELSAGDVVVDIGSNDGTTLGFYPSDLTLIGVDPTASKFRDHYKKHVAIVADFFSASAVESVAGNTKAKVISSFSMFYDLEKPLDFVTQIQRVLHKDGIWVFEQSYLPSMLAATAYDTVCHEHLEYYGLAQVEWILHKVGMHLVDVELNDTNGGSFSVVAAHKNSGISVNQKNVDTVKLFERKSRLDSLSTYAAFSSRVEKNRADLRNVLADFYRSGKRICGIGASTKGNVVLQYCGFGPSDIEFIGDINPDKFGSYTPGSWIPIRSESEVLDLNPDVLLVLPWHFRTFFESSSIFKGRKMLFPLPEIEIVII